VVEYWAVSRDLSAMGGHTVTPDSYGEVICCADELYAVGGGKKERLPSCFIVGLLREPLRFEGAGVVRCMAARLHPWVIGRFLRNSSGHPLCDCQDATDLFGSRLASVIDLVKQCDWQTLALLFDEVLIEQFGRFHWDATDVDVVAAFVSDQRYPTTTVADEQGTSSRQVERRVRRLTGASPKQLASLTRFQAARDAIWADPSIDLARLAAEVGYADQPHLTREFRRYSGLTPARFARESAARKRWLADHDVAFVQDRSKLEG
jgi:AraC-like DNA-binding protein